MDDRVVVVNGGAGRIGSQMCLALADAGAKVVILDLDQQRAAEVAETITQSGGQAIGIGADSTDQASLDAALAQTVEQLGAPYGLVNATQYRGSGFYGSDPADHPIDAWEQVFKVNVTGVLMACQTLSLIHI